MPRASINGINLYYRVFGRGEPLVLIMGFGGAHEGWFFQTRAFKRHYQVVVFDNRGLGRSDKSAQPYTIATMADDTVGLMDHLGIDSAHILGQSLGGIVAQELAICHPERVRKLVLVSTSCGEGEITDVHPEMLKAIGVEDGSAEPNLEKVDFYESTSTIVSLAFNKKLYRTLLVPLSRYNLKKVGVDGHRAQMQAVVGHTTADRLHLIQVPTLVITGSDDRIVSPRSSEAIASRIPDSRLVMVEGGSHALNLEMRNRFNSEVLDFLRQ
jgi:3-oxoadipate enol-lactonase